MKSLAVLSALVLAVILPAGALAAWSAQGSGHAAGAAAVMPTGNAPTAVLSGSDIVVTWPAATFANGTPVAGYVIHRYDANTGAPATVGAGCSGVVTTTTCTENNVPAGSWVYTDTPVQQNWTGGESPDSNSA